jgi:hypothetical protein
LPANGGNGQFRTKGCLREAYGHLAENVVVVATKELVRINRDFDK